jgi:hypothetical protein
MTKALSFQPTFLAAGSSLFTLKTNLHPFKNDSSIDIRIKIIYSYHRRSLSVSILTQQLFYRTTSTFFFYDLQQHVTNHIQNFSTSFQHLCDRIPQCLHDLVWQSFLSALSDLVSLCIYGISLNAWNLTMFSSGTTIYYYHSVELQRNIMNE